MSTNKCSQCDKQAFALAGPANHSQPLCLDHWAVFQSILSKQNEDLERSANMLQRQMYDTVGLPPPTPLFAERKPKVVIHQPNIDNSIHIDRSVVASVNTGTIQNLEVSMSHINNNNTELAKSLKAFTESVAKEHALTSEQRQEILDQLSALLQEVERPKASQRKSVLKTLMGGIKSGIQGAVTLDGLWSITERLIRAAAGL